MTDTTPAPDRPGEARTRQRQRRQLLYLLVAVLLGLAIGAATGWFDRGDGNLFAGDWEDLALPPWVAILLVLGLAFGFIALPVWGFTQIDDFKREHNFIAFTGGSIAVIAGFPIWAVLHAGSFVAAPEAYGVWLLGFGGMCATYAAVWLRSR